MPASRQVAIGAVAAAAAVAVALALGLEGARPRTVEPVPSRTVRPRSWVGGPELVLGAPAPPRTFVGPLVDGGTPFLDASAEPDTLTGVIARAVTERVCPAATRILCTSRARVGCGPMTPVDEGDEVTRCEDIVAQQCADWAARHYGADDDREVVSERAVQQCLAALEAGAQDGRAPTLDLSCGELAADPAPEGERCLDGWLRCGRDGLCRDEWCEPAPGEGEPCESGQCARDLVCTGECVRPIPHGGRCDDDFVCADPRDFCLDGRCVDHVPEGGACEYDTECAIGSRCTDARCTPVRGDDCTLDEECGQGRICAGDYAARCETFPHLDAPCASDADCDPWLGCFDGRCGTYVDRVPGWLREGDVCASGLDTSGCRAGLVCTYDAGAFRCERGAAAGERCEERACVVSAMCVWRVADGHCEPATCAVSDYFGDADDE